MKLQLHQHFDTQIDRSCSLHKATNHNLFVLEPQNNGSKKSPTVRKLGVAAFSQAHVSAAVQGGRGFSGDPDDMTPTVRWDTAETEAASCIQE